MRKIYKTASLACLGLVLASQNTNAQSVSDFESLTLGVESAWDGSDLSGSYTPINFTTNFISGDAVFNNDSEIVDLTDGKVFFFLNTN
ncbi:MAG: hypothetical protein HRT73_07650 [Flavobacteriales bacterium]|nr:hypothetical protein [Flavobacteriales bacterium]